MSLTTWHYSLGLSYYLTWWKRLFHSVIHYFAFRHLLRYLFAPWKRITASSGNNASLNKRWETFTFNFISRFIGGLARLLLCLAGIMALGFVLIIGIGGLFVWLICPPLSKPLKKRHELLHLTQTLGTQNLLSLSQLLDNPAGHFFCHHIGLDKKILLESATSTHIDPQQANSLSALIQICLTQNIWSEEWFRNHAITPQDFLLAANWWDYHAQTFFQVLAPVDLGPSLGTELTYGYTPNLDRYATDMNRVKITSADIPRDDIVSRLGRNLSAKSSVILVGPPGVGKKTAILAIAKQLNQSKHFLEVNINGILSEAILDINSKKTILAKTLKEASSAGNIILVIRDMHRFTNSNVEGYDFTDVLESQIDRGLQIIALSDNADYEKYVSPNLKIRKMFETIEVHQPTINETLSILIARADEWETAKHMQILTPTLRKIVDLAQKYITDIPFPTKGVDLLDATVAYKSQQTGKTISPPDALAVISEKTGIPMTTLTPSDKQKLSSLEDQIHKRLIGQDLAVSLIARSLRARATGLAGENKPVGSFLFLGPTGVGKTETAKALAEAYYGSENQIMRFDMAEYSHQDGLVRLLGSAQHNIPGALTTAIKNHAAGLLLLDEIEKAPPQIFNVFLTLLDEGYITDAYGRKINAHHLFIIATSNAGSEVIRELVSNGIQGDQLQKNVIEHILSRGYFSPEFINRFDAAVVYQPLSLSDLRQIAHLQLESLKHRLLSQNIKLEVDPTAVEQLANQGYDPAFGARPMKRIVDLVIADMLSRAMLSEQLTSTAHIRLIFDNYSNQFTWQSI